LPLAQQQSSQCPAPTTSRLAQRPGRCSGLTGLNKERQSKKCQEGQVPYEIRDEGEQYTQILRDLHCMQGAWNQGYIGKTILRPCSAAFFCRFSPVQPPCLTDQLLVPHPVHATCLPCSHAHALPY
jgi:hypothetical protein